MQKNKLKRQLILIIIFLVILPGVLFSRSTFTIIRESINYVVFKIDLEKARELWESKEPNQYEIMIGNVNFINETLYGCQNNENSYFHVSNGQVIDGYDFENCVDVYQKLSVEKMFETVEKEISGINIFMTNWDIQFDSEYGYVSFYYVQCTGSLLIREEKCMSELMIQPPGTKYFGITELNVISEN